MKRITSLMLLVLLIAGVVLTLGSCGSKDGAPDKMQLIRGGEEYGYYFYAPEEWVNASSGEIASTYVSSINYTSATFVKTEMPESESTELTRQELVREYFAGEKAKFPFEITVNTEESGKEATFGNADEAYQYVYSYTYDEKPFTCLQIFVFANDSFYIFTYTASSQKYSDEDGSYYQFYLKNKVLDIIKNFKFVKVKDKPSETVEYPRTEDGYLIVSDKKICGFEMYVPDSYTVDISSSFVSVSKPSGASISMSKLLNTTISIEDNYKQRKEQLSLLADKTVNGSGEQIPAFTEIDGKGTLYDMTNARAAKSYEYTYTMLGVEYRVFQVYVVVGYINPTAYVFTYTASGDDFADGLEEAKAILGRIGF